MAVVAMDWGEHVDKTLYYLITATCLAVVDQIVDYNLKNGLKSMVSSVVYGWLVSLPSADVNELAELAVTVFSLRDRMHVGSS